MGMDISDALVLSHLFERLHDDENLSTPEKKAPLAAQDVLIKREQGLMVELLCKVGGPTATIQEAIQQFERYRKSGWSKSEIPNSACLLLVINALNLIREWEQVLVVEGIQPKAGPCWCNDCEHGRADDEGIMCINQDSEWWCEWRGTHDSCEHCRPSALGETEGNHGQSNNI